jgi:SRSO17 transposase
MDEQQLLALKPELDRSLGRFAPLFGTEHNQAHARCFVQGLLHQGERKNSENIAQAIAGGNVRNLQAFITTGAWHDRQVLAQRRRDCLAVLAGDDAAWNSDETGFPKKGTRSAGVQRQYSGTLGRTDNCQVGVFANYCSAKGHSLMDRRLYLPREWAEDPARRAEAGVPDEVVFRTKPELALEVLADACAAGVPSRRVGGDSVYGDDLTFVRGARSLGKWYVLDIGADTLVWADEPEVIPPSQRQRGKGRPPSRPAVIGARRRVDEVIAALPATAWRRVMVGEGSQGPRMYAYAEAWVWLAEGGLPGPRARLLARRSIGQEPELKYHRCNAPPEVPMQKVAQGRATRWTIEEDVQSGKGECGLDEYETRGWVGWHHHTALPMLALAFLVIQEQRLGGKRAAGDGAGSARPVTSPAGGAGVGHR